MTEGGNDGRRERRKDEKALLPRPRAIVFGRVPPYSWLINSSFLRKRESRDLCDRKVGIGRTAFDSRSPIGGGDKLRGNDGGVVDSRFRGNDGWVGVTEGGNDGSAGMTEARE